MSDDPGARLTYLEHLGARAFGLPAPKAPDAPAVTTVNGYRILLVRIVDRELNQERDGFLIEGTGHGFWDRERAEGAAKALPRGIA